MLHLFALAASQWYTMYYEIVINSGRFRGGGRAPPLGKPKNVKGPHQCKITGTFGDHEKSLLYYPPPTESHRVGFWRPRESSATTTPPPPPLNRVGLRRPQKFFATTPPPLNRVDLAASHERGRLLRKILDLRLINIIHM